MKHEQVKAIAAGEVVLKVDRIDAHQRVCPAGTQIAPNVDGWPSHRVAHEVFHGYAEKGTGSKMTHPSKPEPNIDRKDINKLLNKMESLVEENRKLTVESREQQRKIVELSKQNESLLAQIDDLNKQLADAKAEQSQNKKPKG